MQSIAAYTALLTVNSTAIAQSPTRAANNAEYEVFAIQYGVLASKVSSLVVGADTSRRVDGALMFWLLKGADGRNVLVDAGFQRADFIERRKPVNYERPDLALQRAGVKPQDVSDIVITHIHWDHFDGAELFPNAKIWLQREEYTHHVDSTGRAVNRAIDSLDAQMLVRLNKAGRVILVDGDAKEIIPGITVYTGGKHTFQSQYAGVRIAGGTVVIASDNVYLYENLEQHRPIMATPDSISNLQAQRRMSAIASSPRLIVPGHDPAVMTRFELVAPGVVRVK